MDDGGVDEIVACGGGGGDGVGFAAYGVDAVATGGAEDVAASGDGCDSGGEVSAVSIEWRADQGADDDHGEFSVRRMRGVLLEDVRQKQIPPLRCGMTTKRTTAPRSQSGESGLGR